MQDGQSNLGNDMFRCNKVDVVALADILQLHVPFGELFGCEIEAVTLVSNVMVLTEDLRNIKITCNGRLGLGL